MSYRIGIVVGLVLIGIALASPAWAEDRSDVRDAVNGAASTAPAERLVRYDTPRWAEVTTQDGACCPKPCCPEPMPCCLPYEAPCGEPCRWTGVVSLLVWVPGVTGDVTARGRDAEVDATPIDIIENLDKVETIFMGAVSVYRGKWGFHFGGLTVRFEDSLDLKENGNTVTGGIGLDMVEGYVSYCLSRCPTKFGCDPRCPGSTAYEVYAGLRYFSAQVSLDAAGRAVPGVKQVKSWVDPIIGGKVTWDLGNRWMFDFQADVGGFGVGSDFAWSARLGATYRFTRMLSTSFGFKATGMDYTDGSGANRFKFDAVLWGPYATLNFHF